MISRARLLVVVGLALTACSRQPPPPPTAAVKPAPAHSTAAGAAEAGRTVVGPVLETMNASSYTYVRVQSDAGEIWAATPQFTVKVGDRVRVPLEMPMTNFHSSALGRDFPLIYFVSSIVPADGASASNAAATQTGGDIHGAMRSPTSAVTTPMPAPPGGLTIASLWASRKTLAGKPVTIHGVVVKYNPGILGRNWIHLQDGTGKAADGNNDVTVTSSDDVPVKVGDTLVVTGTAVVDKNIGDGYQYPVLVENARISSAKQSQGSLN